MPKRKMPNALKQVRNRAKKIRRQHPGMTYQSALKKAGKERREKKHHKPKKRIGMAKKKQRSVTPHRSGKKRSGGSGSKKSPARLRSELKKALLLQVGDLSSRQFATRTKTGKRKIAKKIRAAKQEYNKLAK